MPDDLNCLLWQFDKHQFMSFLSSQINNVEIRHKKANGTLAILCHYVLRQVYYAMFHSYLQYCIKVWGQPVNFAQNHVVSLQKCANRLMSFELRRTSSSKLFANLEILKFNDMVHLQNMLFLHNLFHKSLPVSVQNT